MVSGHEVAIESLNNAEFFFKNINLMLRAAEK